MQGRRRVVAAVGALAGLGGCGRVVRPNDVPGGVQFVNRRDTRESVTLRAFRLFAGTPGEGTPTPVEREPVAAGRFPVPAGATATNDDFFPAAGRYVVAASNRGATARGRIELFETLGGGLGADTVVVRLPADGDVTLRVTDVD